MGAMETRRSPCFNESHGVRDVLLLRAVTIILLTIMTKMRWLSAALMATSIVAFFALDLGGYLTLEYLQSQHAHIKAYYTAHPCVTALAFSLIYTLTAGLSLPGSSLLPLLAGSVFGLFWGTVLVSVASTIAATLEFLAARYLLRDAIQSRFSSNVRAFNIGIEKEGAYYIFALRLIPFAPFLIINLVMGLTPIKTLTYIGISLVGLLASSAVYVNIGTELGRLDSLSSLLSPSLIVSFTILGFFPLIAKKLLNLVYSYRVSRGF
jgi:uncharacterized membrane protein YdjX (TVP38/TMEM64 family)